MAAGRLPARCRQFENRGVDAAATIYCSTLYCSHMPWVLAPAAPARQAVLNDA